jgi:hypothetical protein
MKLGILADTHDNLAALRVTLKRFAAAGVTQVLHAGDLCSPFVFLEFKSYPFKVHAVYGNNDGEWLFLDKLAKPVGSIVKGPAALEIGGKRVALMHEPVFLDALADSGHFDLIVYGHTHDLIEHRRGEALVLNPGENCGYLRKRATALILDLDAMTTELVEAG